MFALAVASTIEDKSFCLPGGCAEHPDASHTCGHGPTRWGKATSYHCSICGRVYLTSIADRFDPDFGIDRGDKRGVIVAGERFSKCARVRADHPIYAELAKREA